jgi:hypothetical protein
VKVDLLRVEIARELKHRLRHTMKAVTFNDSQIAFLSRFLAYELAERTREDMARCSDRVAFCFDEMVGETKVCSSIAPRLTTNGRER